MVPPCTLPEKLAMSGVISTVIDSSCAVQFIGFSMALSSRVSCNSLQIGTCYHLPFAWAIAAAVAGNCLYCFRRGNSACADKLCSSPNQETQHEKLAKNHALPVVQRPGRGGGTVLYGHFS